MTTPPKGIKVRMPRTDTCAHCGRDIIESPVTTQTGWRHVAGFMVWCKGQFGQDTAMAEPERK